MPDFFALSAEDRREALATAADKSGRPIHLLEKDVWVVWTLRELFGSAHGEHLVFKGGTSLSKCYDVIHRFSEDIDLTYDIRVIAPDLVGGSQTNLPSNNSQRNKWRDEINERLAKLISEKMMPELAEAIRTRNLPAKMSADSESILLEFDPVAPGYGYVKPIVMLEFGARSTGEPNEMRDIVCDAALYVPNAAFPTAKVRAMLPERTFWEKATAIHVFCHQGKFRGGDRYARHWHDLTRLDATGYATKAIVDKKLANDVAVHKSAFFVEKDANGAVIDYHQAVAGALQLSPSGEALEALAKDYKGMVDDGLLVGEAASFEKLLETCKAIQDRANAPDK